MNPDKWNLLNSLTPEFRREIKSAFVFGHNKTAMVVTVNDEVFGIGANHNYELGVETVTNCTFIPSKIQILCGKEIKSIVSGKSHVVALTNRGDIYTWGANEFGQLGMEERNNNNQVPVMIPKFTDVPIKEIVCGSNHTLALDEDGMVWGWGDTRNKQVDNDTEDFRPRECLEATSVFKNIACTEDTSFAVTAEGRVCAWGKNSNGERGLPSDTNFSQATSIDIELGIGKLIIVKVVCGRSHVLGLTDTGNVYGWGSNNLGQLGIGVTSACETPKLTTFDFIGRIADIAASRNSDLCVAITISGCVFMWGGYGEIYVITSPILTPYTLMSDVFACFDNFAGTGTLLPVQNEECQSGLINNMKEAFDDSTGYDLIIEVEGKPIHVHKGFLKIRSEYFKSMFKENWEVESPLKIDKFNYKPYRAYLYYLYTGQVDIEEEYYVELLEIANYCCDDDLRRKCGKLLKSIISPENAALLYAAGGINNNEELRNFSMTYSLMHLTAVVESEAFSTLNIDLMKDFIQMASKAKLLKT